MIRDRFNQFARFSPMPPSGKFPTRQGIAFDVTHAAFDLASCPCSVRTTRSRLEIPVPGESQHPIIEPHWRIALTRLADQHFRIVHQHRSRHGLRSARKPTPVRRAIPSASPADRPLQRSDVKTPTSPRTDAPSVRSFRS